MPNTTRLRAALLAHIHPDTIQAFPEGTHTAADAAAAIGCTLAQIAKSILFRAGELPILVIASGTNRVDPAKLATCLGTKVKRADPAWVLATSGFPVGGVPPLAHLTPPRTILDRDLLALDPIWAAAGSPTHVFRTTAQALLRMTDALVADIADGTFSQNSP